VFYAVLIILKWTNLVCLLSLHGIILRIETHCVPYEARTNFISPPRFNKAEHKVCDTHVIMFSILGRFIFRPRYWKGVRGSASHPGGFLPPGKTRYSLYRRLGGPQGRSGQVRKISPPTGIQSPDRPARSQSLYRLIYPAHVLNC
jgi:hypothetical protein